MFQYRISRINRYDLPPLYHDETATTIIFLVGGAIALPSAIALLVMSWKFALVVFLVANLVSAILVHFMKPIWDYLLMTVFRRLL